MITGNVSNWTSIVGTDVPFVTVTKTNNKVSNNNGVFSILRSGIYDIDANLIVGGVAGDITATLYADGEATDVIAQTSLAETSSLATLPLTDAIKVVFAMLPSVATVSVRLDTAGLNVSGNIRIQYEQ